MELEEVEIEVTTNNVGITEKSGTVEENLLNEGEEKEKERTAVSSSSNKYSTISVARQENDSNDGYVSILSLCLKSTKEYHIDNTIFDPLVLPDDGTCSWKQCLYLYQVEVRNTGRDSFHGKCC